MYTLFKQWNKGFGFSLSPTPFFFCVETRQYVQGSFHLACKYRKNRFLSAYQHLRLDELWVEGNKHPPPLPKEDNCFYSCFHEGMEWYQFRDIIAQDWLENTHNWFLFHVLFRIFLCTHNLLARTFHNIIVWFLIDLIKHY